MDIVQKVCNRAPAGGRRLRDGCCNRTSDEDCSDRESCKHVYMYKQGKNINTAGCGCRCQ